MKNFIVFFILLPLLSAFAQNRQHNGDPGLKKVILKNTQEADVMIRIGDIDNLGFGWEEEYDPFSGRPTYSHPYPWEVQPDDPKGTDVIMIGSSFLDKRNPLCGSDGYSENNPAKAAPVIIPLAELKGTDIKSASLIMFIDDFQAPEFCSKFRAYLNKQRFTDLERVINSVTQTGPVGKVINVVIPDELLSELKGENLSLFIDDSTTSAADGFAIDFVKLLINPKPYPYKGELHLRVMKSDDQMPIAGAVVEIKGTGKFKTDGNGYIVVNNLNAGLVICDVSAEGRIPKSAGFDVFSGGDIPEQEIYLDDINQYSVEIDGKALKQGDALLLNNIQFAGGSDVLDAAGMQQLDQVFGVLEAYPRVDIEIAGYTSSEGDAAFNKELSLRRVESCKKYLAGKGIAGDRISTVGYGPENPVADNSTEEGRKLNRRVEMKILRIN